MEAIPNFSLSMLNGVRYANIRQYFGIHKALDVDQAEINHIG